jgi:hypothetical protein
LKWETASEIDNAGFNIYRSESKDGEYTQINDSIITTEGSSTVGATYEFIDTNVQNGKTYYYELQGMDMEGYSSIYGSVSATPIDQFINVYVDIKPGSCPNPIGFAGNKGVMPFTIMGSTDFDITQIDPESIRITREGVDAEVKPIRWSYEDVATPFEGELCDCYWLKGDGIMDLAMNIYRDEIVEHLRLQEVAGMTIPLTVTGKLKDEFGGTSIEGKDCVWVLKSVLKGEIN